MEAGDKVRLKHFFVSPNGVHFNKGEVGKVQFLDPYNDVVFVEFDKAMIKFTTAEMIDYFEMVKLEPNIPVPTSLISWYKQTEPYVGGSRD